MQILTLKEAYVLLHKVEAVYLEAMNEKSALLGGGLYGPCGLSLFNLEQIANRIVELKEKTKLLWVEIAEIKKGKRTGDEEHTHRILQAIRVLGIER